MTLNVDSLLCRQSYVCCDQTAEVRITRFSYEVALYLSRLYIKFDDEITRKSRRISNILSYLLVSKVKLTSKLGFTCSQMSQLLRL